jgi:hypothetical protein
VWPRPSGRSWAESSSELKREHGRVQGQGPLRGGGPRTFARMHALPPSCPPLPEFPPLFWNRVNEQVAYWQDVFSQPQQP